MQLLIIDSLDLLYLFILTEIYNKTIIIISIYIISQLKKIQKNKVVKIEKKFNL